MNLWTKLLIITSVVFALFCSFFLYRELARRVERTGGEAIGSITFKKRSASRRYSDNVVWEEIEQQTDIFNYDAIRTLEYSSAVIGLKDGTKIEMDQNTLLVVILNDKGLNINFDQGSVSAESGSGEKGPITLKSKDAVIALDKGGISLSGDESGINIQVNSGTAKVAAAGKMLSISSDQITTLKNGIAESRKVSLFPESPKNNSYFVTFGKILDLNFSWSCDPPGEAGIEISRSSDFKSILKRYNRVKPGLVVDLPAGDYYWRIVRDRVLSKTSKFTILSDNKPELIAPHDNQKFTVTEGSEIVTFRWRGSEYAAAYKITAARDRGMSDVALILESRSDTISSTGLEPGRYYWTVKSIYPENVISDQAVSGPDVFEVESVKFSLEKPVLLDQGPVTTAGPFNLNWKGVQGSKSYKVEISSDSEFKKIVITKSTVNTFVKMDRELVEGKYFWRVSALSVENNSSLSSTAVLTLVKPVEIVPLNPVAGAVLTDRPSMIRFSWRDPNRGNKYLLQISDRPDFRNIRETAECVISESVLKSPGEGSFYWNVILKDGSGNTIARSPVSEFSIPGGLKTPVQIIPRENEKIIPGIKKRIRFQWEKTAGASEYEIEIFLRVAGVDKTLMIFSSKSNSIELSNTGALTPGIYSWQVKAKRINNRKVTAYTESKKRYFEIEEVEILPAPEIKTPGIIFK